ncbi:histidine kinase [Nonomuraea sp. CA-141351]|uniref:sensor histidine kinase n=1 Tax=Nonomuraea sp. CA-141351 TaxID=3239996 RepID=UPI003D8FFAAA
MTFTGPATVAVPADNGRRAARSTAAVALGVAAVVEVLLWAVLARVNGQAPARLVGQNEVTGAAVAVSFGIVGAVIVRSRPNHALGWIFVAEGQFQGLCVLGAQYAQRTPPLPLAGLAAFLGAYVWFPGMLLAAAFIIPLFPDGRAASPRWRPLLWVGGAAVTCGTVAVFLSGAPMRDEFPRWTDPFALPPGADATLMAVAGASLAVAVACGLAGAAGLVLRLRRAEGPERRRIGWFFVPFLVGLLAQLPPDDTGLLPAAAWGFFPVALGVATVRHGLFGADRLLSRTLVYVALTVLVAGVFGLFVGLASNVLGGQGTGAVAAAVVIALGLSPAQALVQRAIDRLLYGGSRDPYTVITDLGRQLSAAIAPDEVLAIIVRTVAVGLRLPYAEVTLEGEHLPASLYGEPSAGLVHLRLRHAGQDVGRLTIGLREGQRRLDPADERLLHDFARHAGAAADGVRLTRDLRRSRDRVLAAREEERHRIRRDLHDGLGPTLAGVALGLGAARRAVGESGPAELLGRLESEVVGGLDEVRRMVADLRPAGLADLGLVAAVRRHADTLSARTGGALSITVTAPEDLPSLVSAVEVAAYRIVLEALTNVARHAHAQVCDIDVSTGPGVLRLSVRDDGVGIERSGPGRGIGLRSMAERAAELGGTCEIGPADGGGTLVLATLRLEG